MGSSYFIWLTVQTSKIFTFIMTEKSCNSSRLKSWNERILLFLIGKITQKRFICIKWIVSESQDIRTIVVPKRHQGLKRRSSLFCFWINMNELLCLCERSNLVFPSGSASISRRWFPTSLTAAQTSWSSGPTRLNTTPRGWRSKSARYSVND